ANGVGEVLAGLAPVASRPPKRAAERAAEALAHEVRERPHLGVVRVVLVALRQEAIGDRVLLVEREEAPPRRAMAMADERLRLEREAAPGAPLHAPREVEVAAERDPGVEAAERLDETAVVRGVRRLRERKHGMRVGPLRAERPARLVALDERPRL